MTNRLTTLGCFLCLFCLLNFDASGQPNPVSKDDYLKTLDQKIPAWLDEFIVPGAAIALIDDGQIILQKGYGFADVQNNVKVGLQTGFNIGSISKTVSAWGVMKLVEAGKIDLDSPVEKYLTRWKLPASDFDAKGVTVRRLLSHTAGLSLHGYPGWAPGDKLPSLEESLSGATNGAGDVRLVMEPGTRWQYSGGGYTLLQLIVEEVTGRSFAEYMQSEVLNPLGMKNSSFTIDETILKASSLEHNGYGAVIPFELFTAQAAAGLHTTIEDFAKFALASLNHPSGSGLQNILKPGTLESMMAPAPAANGRYGLGYSIDPLPNSTAVFVGHGGANDGWHAWLQVDPKTGNGFMMLTNGGSGHEVYTQAYYDWVEWKLGVSLGRNSKKGLTPLLIKTYQKEGVEAAIAKFKNVMATQADTYRFSEGTLNGFGYDLLQSGHPKDALQIFKANVEAYPNGFNTYDSYGEVLLLLGDTTQAIENYKKSLQLNPESQSGLNVLKALGVPTDAFLKKIPLEHLKLLAGSYSAVDKPGNAPLDWNWTIDIELANGALTGNDRGYRYRLIPLGDDVFMNPDDGARLVFDSKDKDNLSFVLFGKFKFQKLKTPSGKQSISKVLRENGHLPVAERVALYLKLKKESPDGYNFDNEDELTMYGYSLLWAGQIEEAIEIFKLIVAQFPNSSNPYDSLGEGYMAHGDTELAILNYEKSLALNPDNFNAEDQVERLKNPGKKPETPAEKFAKVFSPEAYRADLDQLGKTLLAVHPNALKFITKAAFWKNIEEKKALITAQTTYGEFSWHCAEIIASIHCSHTDKGRFFFEHQMLPTALRFPLKTRWVNDRLFVIDPMNNAGKVAVKDEILSINGITVPEIVRDIYKHITAQGYVETTKKHAFNTWSTGMIAYALGFPETYKIKVKGKSKAISLNKAESVKDPLDDPSIKYCQDNLCFEVLEGQKTAILTVSSFNYYPWGNLDVFVRFMDSTFHEIHRLGIKNLVIDVRFNGGGSQQASIHLLKYLNNKPFSYYQKVEFEGKEGPIDGENIQTPFDNSFKGNLYFIIDGHGNSTTGHFMSVVKALKLGTIVGEELGSNHFCSAGQKICRLSNTKLEYNVANNTHVSLASSPKDEVGVLPDHFVTQSIEDYLKKVDTVKEYTLKLIKK